MIEFLVTEIKWKKKFHHSKARSKYFNFVECIIVFEGNDRFSYGVHSVQRNHETCQMQSFRSGLQSCMFLSRYIVSMLYKITL
jgi:hypothetical protein